MPKTVLLLDNIGPEAEPIIVHAGIKVVDAKKGFGGKVNDLNSFVQTNFKPQELKVICLRSSTILNAEAMTLLRQFGVELIIRFGAGTDNIDLLAACQNGILVANTPGQNATSVAEKTIAMAMILSHRLGLPIGGHAAILAVTNFAKIAKSYFGELTIPDFDQLLADFIPQLTVKKALCQGTELYGKTMGIIGCRGAIGMKVATRARDLRMNVLGIDASRRPEIEGVTCVSLAELLAQSDFVTVHVPLSDKTRGLIGAKEIAQMKSGAFLLNLARAGIVDVDAVLNDFVSVDRRLAGYGSDVDQENHPIFERKDAIVWPHIGAATLESEARCAEMGANQAIAWIESGRFENGVNFPEMVLENCRNGQVTVIHDDKPGVIEELSGIFKNYGINIGPFKTVPGKKGFACTMIGPDSRVGSCIIGVLSNLDGVIRVIPTYR